MAIATSERSKPKYEIRQQVRTEVAAGEVVDVVRGSDRGWAYKGWYYLIATGHHPKPFWATEKEIVSAGRKPA